MSWKANRAGQVGIAFALCLLAFAPARAAVQSADLTSGLDTIYAGRSNPIWFVGNQPTPAAGALPAIFRRAPLDGFADGPTAAGEIQRAMDMAARDSSKTPEMDRMISSYWVRYVQTLEAPMPGFEYADERMPSRIDSAITILANAAANKGKLLDHVHKVSEVNPIYSALRQAIWNDQILSNEPPSETALANLSRARFFLPNGKAVLIDAGEAKLYMFEQGELVDAMKVVVGKPETPTPLIASTIYYATLNPYWHVPSELVQHLIGPRVLAQGATYLKDHHYEIVTKYGPSGTILSPSTISWKAVVDGTAHPLLRQLPGPSNSMGALKFPFANSANIYLHDTPNKQPFTQNERLLSNGCIRLEDAQKLGRWLLGREPTTQSNSPDEHVLLPAAVPVYVSYLTIRPAEGKATRVADAYGRDDSDDKAALAAR